jgi:hypothetical protein
MPQLARHPSGVVSSSQKKEEQIMELCSTNKNLSGLVAGFYNIDALFELFGRINLMSQNRIYLVF